MGLVNVKKSLSQCSDISVSAICKRRLPVVMARSKMVESLKDAVTYIEQGHIRVGPEVVLDPAFLVTRNMEDFVTWVDSSKIKRKILQHNEQVRRCHIREYSVLCLLNTNYEVGRLRSALTRCLFSFRICQVVAATRTAMYKRFYNKLILRLLCNGQ